MLLRGLTLLGNNIFTDSTDPDTLYGILHAHREHVLVNAVHSLRAQLGDSPEILHWCQVYAHRASFAIHHPTTPAVAGTISYDAHFIFLQRFSGYYAKFLLEEFNGVLQEKLLTALTAWIKGDAADRASQKPRLISLLENIIPHLWSQLAPSVAGDETSKLYTSTSGAHCLHPLIFTEGDGGSYSINEIFRAKLRIQITRTLQDASILCSHAENTAALSAISELDTDAQLERFARELFEVIEGERRITHYFDFYLYSLQLETYKAARQAEHLVALLPIDRLLEMITSTHGLQYLLMYCPQWMPDLRRLNADERLRFFAALRMRIEFPLRSDTLKVSALFCLCVFSRSPAACWSLLTAVAHTDTRALEALYRGLLVADAASERSPNIALYYLMRTLPSRDALTLFLQLSRPSVSLELRSSVLRSLCLTPDRKPAALALLVFKTIYPFAVIQTLYSHFHNPRRDLMQILNTIENLPGQSASNSTTLIPVRNIDGTIVSCGVAQILVHHSLAEIDFPQAYTEATAPLDASEHHQLITALLWQRIMEMGFMECRDVLLETLRTTPLLMLLIVASVPADQLDDLWERIHALPDGEGARTSLRSAIDIQDERFHVSARAVYERRHQARAAAMRAEDEGRVMSMVPGPAGGIT